MRLRTILCASLTAPLVLAADIRGSLIFDSVLPGPQALSPSSKISLDHGARHAFVRQDGSFEISDVPEGEHVLTPDVPGYSVSPLLVTVLASSLHVQAHFPSRQALPPSSPSLPYPIQLHAIVREDYYHTAVGMNILGMLKNPMVLMMLFSAGMMYFLPKLMASVEMDPDMAREMAETRKKMHGMQNMDWAGSLSNMLAGSSPDESTSSTAVTAGGTTTPNKAGGAGGASSAAGSARRRKGK
ncbi:hypothetical protein JCM24511_00481 [Saitozyma sp. JCM 24511]|nr:hypothetical protein JCM24511_00481 [Saitozyma sp. JCM 24511]